MTTTDEPRQFVRSNRATGWKRDQYGRTVARSRRPGPWHVVGQSYFTACGAIVKKLGLASDYTRGTDWPAGRRCAWCDQGTRKPGAGHAYRTKRT